MSVHQCIQDLPHLPKKRLLFQLEFQAQGGQALALSGMEDSHSGFIHSFIPILAQTLPQIQEPSGLLKCEDYLLFSPY